jgi:ketosteroid isomerase-like protein
MSRANVDIIRELWDAYSSGDFDRVLSLCDDHVVSVTLEEGALCGPIALRENHERWKEAWEGAETALEEVRAGSEDQVFAMARFRARGRASGVEIKGRLYEVYVMRNGKVLRVDEFRDRADALGAAGLRD